MGTSLTPEFWEQFALLLFAAMGVTFALTALFDTLALRRTIRRTRRTPVTPERMPHRPRTTGHRPTVHC